jgi:hypothetical protein
MRTFTLTERLAARFNFLPTAIYDTFPAVLFGRVLVLSTRLGVFESLNRRSQTSNELATSLHLHPEAIKLILPPLVTASYLTKQGETYTLAPQSKKWLVQSSAHYLGNFIAYIELLHSHWITLEETFTSGKPPRTYVETFTEQEWNIYTLGMMDLAKLIIPHIMPKMELPSTARRLIDVCGSHGLYSIELCKRYKNLTATIADFPQVLHTTQALIEKDHLEERITLFPCDVMKTEFKKDEYDVALAFNIIHGFNAETNATFLRSISSALKRGGIFYILDQLKDETKRGIGKMLPLLVGVNLLNEIGGSVYSFGEVTSWCKAAGFGSIQRCKTRLPGVHLIKAIKR